MGPGISWNQSEHTYLWDSFEDFEDVWLERGSDTIEINTGTGIPENVYDSEDWFDRGIGPYEIRLRLITIFFFKKKVRMRSLMLLNISNISNSVLQHDPGPNRHCTFICHANSFQWSHIVAPKQGTDLLLLLFIELYLVFQIDLGSHRT